MAQSHRITAGRPRATDLTSPAHRGSERAGCTGLANPIARRTNPQNDTSRRTRSSRRPWECVRSTSGGAGPTRGRSRIVGGEAICWDTQFPPGEPAFVSPPTAWREQLPIVHASCQLALCRGRFRCTSLTYAGHWPPQPVAQKREFSGGIRGRYQLLHQPMWGSHRLEQRLGQPVIENSGWQKVQEKITERGRCCPTARGLHGKTPENRLSA
jgi:hypothetical protein